MTQLKFPMSGKQEHNFGKDFFFPRRGERKKKMKKKNKNQAI